MHKFRETRARPRAVGAAVVLLLAVAACSGGGGGGPATATSLASGATFTLGLNADPQGLDPQATQLTSLRQVASFLYDSLVSQQGDTIVPSLATSWTQRGRTIAFRLRDGVTCSDSTPLTAADVAANLNYVANPKNASGLLGVTIPPGSTAAAVGADTVTLTTPAPTGFLLQGVAGVPIVCAKGLADRKLLASGADGTGPYTLTAATPGVQYTLTRRAGYTWGPASASTARPGLPKTVVVKVITNETTTANLLLGGTLDAATVAGPDTSRLAAAHLSRYPIRAIYGEFLYNEAPGSPTASEKVRRGLTQAIDLTALRKVAATGGVAPAQLTGESPCPGASVPGQLPGYDRGAATAALRGLAGHPLRLVYPSKLGPQASAAMQLAAQQWQSAGVSVRLSGLTDAQLVAVTYSRPDFDIAWLPVDGQNPLQEQNTFSGPTPAAGGNNFAGIDNPVYDALSARAAAQLGDSGCPLWTRADAALVARSDVVPWADIDYPLWGVPAVRFSTVFGTIVPTSIRVSA